MKNVFIPSWLDDLKLNIYEFRLYCHAIRRGELYASVESICHVCGFDRKKLFKTIASLEAKQLFQVTREKGKTNRILALQPVPKTEHLRVPHSEHLPVPKTEHGVCRIRNTKDTPIKETPIKEDLFVGSHQFPFDSEAFKNTWQMWESERKQRKKPLSKSAIKLQIGKMKGHTEKEVIEAIQASIEKGWATIYPKKEITTNEPRSIYEPAKPRSIYD
jgi:hypothetical protein